MVLAACTVWSAGALYFAAPTSPPCARALRGASSHRHGSAGGALHAALAAAGARGVSRVLHRAPRLVGDARAVQRARLAADVAILPLVELDGELATVRNIRNYDYRSRPISPALLRQDFRPAQARVGGSLRRVLDGAAYRAHDSQLRLRGQRASRGLDRDAQGKNELFGPGRLLPAIRAVLRGCRRARRHPPAHEPQGSAGRYLRLPPARPGGERPALAAGVPAQDQRAPEQAEFYNTLTARLHRQHLAAQPGKPGHLPFSWKLHSGGSHVPEYLHQAGKLDPRVSFEELARASRINARARAADQAPDFSRRIRMPASAR